MGVGVATPDFLDLSGSSVAAWHETISRPCRVTQSQDTSSTQPAPIKTTLGSTVSGLSTAWADRKQPLGLLALTKETRVAYSLNCKDTGQDCGFAVTTQTEDELMQHVATHAAAAHPDLELTPETVAAVKGLIRES